MKLFEEMFGSEFWQHCILIFTKISMDSKEVQKRRKHRQMSDDDFAETFKLSRPRPGGWAAGRVDWIAVKDCQA